jgi:two-component system NtrC family sensor kinase
VDVMADDRDARIAQLEDELRQREAELRAAHEQLAATAEVLRVSAASPTDVQRVLDTIAESVARLCGGRMAGVQQCIDGPIVVVAGFPKERFAAYRVRRQQGWIGVSPTHDAVSGRALLERRTVHVPDIEAAGDEFPETLRASRTQGFRSLVAAPLLRGEQAIGLLVAVSDVPHPFSDRGIALLEAFTDQAVIAIENARLFSEVEQRNHDLNEALEQQTATSDILRVIASSPTDVQRVLDAIADITQRLCGADVAWVQGEVDGHLRTLSRGGGVRIRSGQQANRSPSHR